MQKVRRTDVGGKTTKTTKTAVMVIVCVCVFVWELFEAVRVLVLVMELGVVSVRGLKDVCECMSAARV